MVGRASGMIVTNSVERHCKDVLYEQQILNDVWNRCLRTIWATEERVRNQSTSGQNKHTGTFRSLMIERI